jgi:hypothetical protein
MPGAVEEMAEAARAVGLEAQGLEAAVVPVAPVAVGVAVALPMTRQRSLHTSGHRSR